MGLEEFLDARGQPVTVAAGAHLFRQGEHDPRLFFVREGRLKAYYLRADGREHVKSLVGPGGAIGSMAAMEAGGCTFNLVALSEARLIGLPFDVLAQASRTDLELAGAVVDLLMDLARRKERREHDLLCLSAEDRYRRHRTMHPGGVAGVSQADVAGYIGVTPQALSRIKKRVG